jgi:hypothetical protein
MWPIRDGDAPENDTLHREHRRTQRVKKQGIDMFVEPMNRLRNDSRLSSQLLAFVMVPAWMKEPRADLQQKLAAKTAMTVCHAAIRALRCALQSE